MTDNGDLARDLQRGVSLPASWYTDPAIAVRERARIFRRAWQYVGRAEQIARTGDFFTGVAGDVPIVVVRGEDGVRAFINVCRHRRHEVVEGAGNGRTLQCPYHAWTYDLDSSVQRGLRAGLPERARLLTKSEHLVVHFQQLLLSALD